MANLLLAIGFAGNDRLDVVGFEEGAERIGVIAFVREKLRDTGDQADAGFGHHAVGGVARREDQHPGTTKVVDNRMDLAVSTAFGDTYRLRLGPPFPPLAQRWIFTWLLSSATCPGVSEHAATAVKMFCQIPRSLQRAKRL